MYGKVIEGVELTEIYLSLMTDISDKESCKSDKSCTMLYKSFILSLFWPQETRYFYSASSLNINKMKKNSIHIKKQS